MLFGSHVFSFPKPTPCCCHNRPQYTLCSYQDFKKSGCVNWYQIVQIIMLLLTVKPYSSPTMKCDIDHIIQHF